ncbi:MAG TPA: hypothetical protein VFF50_02105 [Candidatus Deferrimicrobiaceae bacterium]|nr:hypothetical protein [Candidatus Deferrimicrobiaceae bacterium]
MNTGPGSGKYSTRRLSQKPSRATGRVVVEVHQVIRDLTGKELLNRTVQHVYSIEGGLIRNMEISE